MAMKRNFDPLLEKLRNEVVGPPNLDTLALNTERLTANIHAGFLFENEGSATLRQLCLLLSATGTGKLYNGWQEFGARLGLTLEQIQCIEYNFKGLQDPTYYVLLTYVQSFDATIDKILMALQKIGRMDVVNRIHDSMNKFIGCLDLRNDNNEIQRPRIVPRAPLVLSPADTMRTEARTRRCDSLNNSGESTNSETNGSLKKGSCYGSIVMLTYAEDGAVTAKNIAKIFRAKERKIGVLILDEQEKHVYSRAEAFVDDCFKQVHYIIPILTSGYIQRINGEQDETLPLQSSLDSKYLKYIHSLLRFEYAKNNCCNNRVRCIVPENDVQTVIKSDLHPTLQAWFREADIDAFTDNILLKKI